MTGLVIFITLFAAVIVLALIRNEVTFRMQTIIAVAMHAYNMHQISVQEYGGLLDYDDIEPYMETFWRLWDWGYTRLLPPDKFELIKPFLPGK